MDTFDASQQAFKKIGSLARLACANNVQNGFKNGTISRLVYPDFCSQIERQSMYRDGSNADFKADKKAF